MITIIPIKNIKAAIRPSFLTHWHEPRIVSSKQIITRSCKIRRPLAFQLISIDTTAMDVAHVKHFPIFFRISFRIKISKAAISRHLMFMLDDGIQFPSEWRVNPGLPVIVTTFCKMPKMIDHTSTCKRRTFLIECNAPRVADTFRKKFELACFGVDTKKRTSEVMLFALMFDFASIENTIEPIKPAIWPPSKGIRKLMRILSAKACNNNFALISLAIVIGILKQKKIRRVNDPNTTMAHCNSRGNIKSLCKDGNLIDFAIVVGVF